MKISSFFIFNSSLTQQIMKKILGLDLGTTSIGWALVNEAETAEEKSSIIRLGVRVVPLSVDEQTNFEKGNPITTNAARTLKRSMRRNLQRYKLRRENLIEILKREHWIDDATLLSENGNNTTFETYALRAKAATEAISLTEFARVLLMINKKRGYKSSRKQVSSDEGQLLDGMDLARQLYDANQTPGQYVDAQLKSGKTFIPDFYRSDLVNELQTIWKVQRSYFNEILADEVFDLVSRKNKKGVLDLFFARFHMSATDDGKRGLEYKKYVYDLRAKALANQLQPSDLVLVIAELAGQINNSSGYLGAISDRSKELYFNHQTVGQYLMQSLRENPNVSLKNKPFYRQDYLDEFERLWETQKQYHPEALTDELKHEIRDVVIFYQRRLKSQKGLVSVCELENRKVCPKSSPLFQEFRILQTLNNVKVDGEYLNDEQREIILSELQYKAELKKNDVLKLLSLSPREHSLNYEKLEGNRTMASLLKACQTIIEMSGHDEQDFNKMSASAIIDVVDAVLGGVLEINTDWLRFDSEKTGEALDQEPLYKLWHLLYSYEDDKSATGDASLIEHLQQMLHMPKEYARVMAHVTFEQDYGGVSAKAIQKLLPFLRDGDKYGILVVDNEYSDLVKKHYGDITPPKKSHELKSRLDLLPKNSLRNPVVEKILNQLVNVVNEIIDTYGTLDEVRIELARELKKSAAERSELTSAISTSTKETERVRQLLMDKFHFSHVSRNDIIRYRLYEELKANGYKTLYSNQYIPEEKIFSKEIDIEHIIPQSRLFDDSFSNKTLEYRDINIEKGNATAIDFVRSKYGEEGAAEYLKRIDQLLKEKIISRSKAMKLKTSGDDIPQDFIDRDLRNTQYISRKAKDMLLDIVRIVTPTTGSVTDRLREDWQLVDVMRELNWKKYDKQGLTQVIDGRDGQRIYRITDWTKRNDHRHHAMDALTVAFTKHSFIQYLNNLNARMDKTSDIYGIEQKELERHDGHMRFLSPILPVEQFRVEAKKQMEQILISIKAKNKVVTRNTNKVKTKQGTIKKVQLTPRGQLHKEHVHSEMKVSVLKEIAVGNKMTAEVIAQVKNPNYRNALRLRLEAFGGDAKKAFTGKNSLEKNPIWLDENHSKAVPTKVVVETFEKQYTIRKPISKELKLDKVVDEGIRRILQARLDAFKGDAGKAFSNLDENPIWLNEEKGIAIKSVRVKELNNAQALHDRRDKEGRKMLDEQGNSMPTDFVNPGNNHHVAIFRDADGNLQEHIVTFYEATHRAMQNLPIIDKEYNKHLGWEFLFTMKQNEYFVFPSQTFNPLEIDLLDESNFALISPNLFRVQKVSTKDYYFRHHLETSVIEVNDLRDITWKRIRNANGLNGIVKVRVNHIGKIVSVGEY